MAFRQFIGILIFLSILFVLGVNYSCKYNTSKEIQVFAASGSMLPISEICDSFENNHNILVNNIYSATGTLARQIIEGAEADIFISADKAWIDYLIFNQILNKDAISAIASNKIVFISNSVNKPAIRFKNDFEINDYIIGNVALGDPKYVPAGKYAKQILDTLNWYNSLKSQLVLTKDVSSVLHLVEQKECEFGIVYLSEALKSDKIKYYEIPAELYKPVIFYIGKLKDNEYSNQLYDYITSKESKDIFIKYGFN